MNKIIIIGNLGRDPEMRYTPSGQAVTSFSVASNRSWTDASGQRKEATDWFNCQCWGRLAEVANQHLQKGQQVFIEGRVSLRIYDKRDGTQGASLDVHVSNIQFLGQRQGQSDAVAAGVAAGHHAPDDDGPIFPDDGDDLPF